MNAPCARCPSPEPIDQKPRSGRRRLLLVGFPNTGKSTFFNRLTGLSQRVGNWPGLTVELASAKVLLGSQMVEVVDLPGINDLSGYSDDEAVVRDVLRQTESDGLVVLLNATQLDRQLRLALQLQATGIPMVLLLNMADEARRFGVEIEVEKLSAQLGVPVVAVSARKGDNWQQAIQAITQLAVNSPQTWLADLNNLPSSVALQLRQSELIRQCVQTPARLSDSLTARVDHWLLHPWLGIPAFLVIMAMMFNLTYELGGPLQDWVGNGLDWLKGNALEPAIAGLPDIVQSLLLKGIWEGVATVLTFAPVLAVFFILLAVVEDSGYLARAAFLMDATMSRFGLDGRGFVMHLMGFGCNVPAVMGTRVMRSRNLRLLSMLTIPFSVCSARLQVFLFFAFSLFPQGSGPWVLLSLYVMSFVVAGLSALIWQKRFPAQELFVLEMPPYRLPTAKHLLMRARHEVSAFLKLASTFIVIGVVLVWVLTNLPAGQYKTMADAMAHYASPVLDPIGIQDNLAVALLFGFVAKEILLGAMAVIYAVPEASLGTTLATQLDWVSAYSFLLFSLIYVPCVSTIAAIRKESGSRWFTAFSVAWSLGLAWVISFVFYQGARALGY